MALGSDEPLSLPDRPSIAVLPFDSLSGDADQEFLADGLAEDITTMLSNLRWMFVSDHVMEETPGIWPRLIRCVALHQLGQHDQAAAAMKTVHSSFPKFSGENIRLLSFFPDPDINGWFLETLSTIGLRD